MDILHRVKRESEDKSRRRYKDFYIIIAAGGAVERFDRMGLLVAASPGVEYPDAPNC